MYPPKFQTPQFKTHAKPKDGAGYTDYSTTLANQHGLYISIYAIHAQEVVAFKAFLTSFSDSFDTSLDVNTFVGHAEPVRKMRAVDRQMQIGLDLPSSNAFEAKENLRNLSTLVKMMYPLVDEQENFHGVVRSHVKAGGDPIFKVKFKNLITGPGASRGDVLRDGLKGYIGNVNYNFDLPSGFFHDIGPHPKGAHKGAADTSYIYPQLINLSFSFFPFNEKLPAWTMSREEGPDAKKIRFSKTNLPYAHTAAPGRFGSSWAAAKSADESKLSKPNALAAAKALGQD